MVAANQANFDTGGTVDPFTGLAPAMTPEEEATARLMKLRYAAQQTSGANVGFQRSQQHGDNTPTTPEEKAAYDEYARQHHLGEYAYGLGHNLANDPVTMGVLAAPYGVLGAGLAVGGAAGLGFGVGEGSLVGTSEPVTMLANEATGGAMAGPGFSQEAANAYNAAGAAGGAVGGAGGAAGSGGAAAFAKNFGLPALEMLGPLAIQQATGGRTKEQKKLVEVQQQMALEAQKRQGQVQDQRMNMLAQQVLAFNPRNQQLAQMVGPQAAFSPEQAAQMVQLPEPPQDPAVMNYTGNDQKILHQKQEMIRRHNEWLQSEQQRRQMMMGGFQAPGPGPAPINMPAPQAARRF